MNNTNLQLTLPRQFPNLTSNVRHGLKKSALEACSTKQVVVRQFLDLQIETISYYTHFIYIVTKQLCNLTLHQFLAHTTQISKAQQQQL